MLNMSTTDVSSESDCSLLSLHVSMALLTLVCVTVSALCSGLDYTPRS